MLCTVSSLAKVVICRCCNDFVAEPRILRGFLIYHGVAPPLDNAPFGGKIGSMQSKKTTKRQKIGLSVTVTNARMCVWWGGAQAVRLHRNCL